MPGESEDTQVSLETIEYKVVHFAQFSASIALRHQRSILYQMARYEPQLLTHRQMLLRAITRPFVDLVKDVATPLHFPMLGYIAKPFNTRRFEADIRIKPAGDGVVDDGLFLLVQQRDELPLGPDVTPDSPVGVIEEPDDGGLFVRGIGTGLAIRRNSSGYS